MLKENKTSKTRVILIPYKKIKCLKMSYGDDSWGVKFEQAFWSVSTNRQSSSVVDDKKILRFAQVAKFFWENILLKNFFLISHSAVNKMLMI